MALSPPPPESFSSKTAFIDLLEVKLIIKGFLVPEISPCHSINFQSSDGKASTSIIDPLL